MSNDKEHIRDCPCDLCKKWHPLFTRVLRAISHEDKVLLSQFLEQATMQGDELCAANAKLEGKWPGWEWMKDERERRGV